MTYLLGIDVGTTNTKALIYDVERQQVVSIGHVPTHTQHPRPDSWEFNPDELWQGVVTAIRQALATLDHPERIKAVAVASMGEAGVPLDANGRWLYPIISWHDPRTEPQRAWWEANIDPFAAFQVTGHPVRLIYGVHKLRWLRENEPSVFQAMRIWLSVEDFILWKLSGEYATDYTIASRTALFDQRDKQWSTAIAARADIDLNLFPRAFPSGTQIGVISPDGSRDTGLSAGIAVVTGGHDHLCGALACGVVAPGTALDSTGTAEALLVPLDRFLPDRRLYEAGYSCYCHVVKDTYVAVGGLTAGGRLVDWLVDVLWAGEVTARGKRDAYTQAFTEAGASPVGAKGLSWLPLAHGGSPTNDPRSRAALVGVNTTHNRGDILRSLLESLGFWLRENLEFLETIVGGDVARHVVAIGGATNSPLWMTIKAETTGRELHASHVGEATALGAAFLAGLGIGLWRDADELVHSVAAPRTIYRFTSDSAQDCARYTTLYQSVYTRLYPILRDVNHTICDNAE